MSFGSPCNPLPPRFGRAERDRPQIGNGDSYRECRLAGLQSHVRRSFRTSPSAPAGATHRTGIANTVDPLAGSYYVESLTTEIERRAFELIQKVDALGGSEKAIAAGFFQDEIGRSAYEHQLRVEAGDAVIVGVNRFADEEEPPSLRAPDYSALEKAQVKSVIALRKKRNRADVKRSLDSLGDAASSQSEELHLMPRIIDAVRARATVGEISATLADTWGLYSPSV